CSCTRRGHGPVLVRTGMNCSAGAGHTWGNAPDGRTAREGAHASTPGSETPSSHPPPGRVPQAPTHRPRSPNPRRRARLGLTAALAVLALALGAAPAVGAKPS